VAGAATAMLLARRGLKVLAVDRATFPSDTLSTHQVQVPGCAALARWGLLGQVLGAGTPPTRTVRFDQGSAAFSARIREFEGVDLMCSPRRLLLDKILVDAARQAGAELRDSFIAEELTRDASSQAVTGLRGRTKGGPLVTEYARLVIGADGRHSLVARLAGAPSYRTRPSRSMGCYTYWSGVPAQPGGQLYGRPGLAAGAWPTNDGLLMTYLAWPAARFAEFRRDVEGNFLRSLDEVGLGERVRAGQRAERFRTAPDLPAWFRKPYGPGWALVGDAGYHKNPITARGITDAFRDAELLAGALLADRPRDEAMASYQRARDEDARPVYEMTDDAARLQSPPPEMQEMLGAIVGDQAAMDEFVSVQAGTLPAAVPVPA
jgi:2-polyprenyl-6-methoxyphenol hydroxylase-like FAD-dependent oxidoreductase